MAPPHRSPVIGRIALLFGILVSVGALVGLGLRLLSIGLILFWLIVGLHAIMTVFLFGMIITIRRACRNGSYRGGNLNEYVILSLIFDSGLIPRMWFQLPWQPGNIAVVVSSCLTLVLAIIVYVRS